MDKAGIRLVFAAHRRIRTRRSARSQAALARCAHRATIVVAFDADAAEELLANGRVVAVADGGDHVTAVVAEVLDGPAGHHVSLVRHEPGEHEEQTADDRADDPTGEGQAFGLEREGGPEAGHARAIPHLGLIPVPWFVSPEANGCDLVVRPGLCDRPEQPP